MRAHVVAALENGKAFSLASRGHAARRRLSAGGGVARRGYERRNHYLWDTEKGMLIESHGKHAAALAKSHPFTETVETDGTVPTFSAIPHSVPHTVHVARHNGPDRGGGHHINLVDECEQLHEILEELVDEAKAKANGGRFTASALARVEASLRDVAAHDLLRSRSRDDGRCVRIVCVVASRYVIARSRTLTHAVEPSAFTTRT